MEVRMVRMNLNSILKGRIGCWELVSHGHVINDNRFGFICLISFSVLVTVMLARTAALSVARKRIPTDVPAALYSNGISHRNFR